MTTHVVNESARRTFVLAYEAGEEVVEGLTALARKEGIQLASFYGIGALQAVTLGFFNPQTEQYDERPLDEDQVEVISLLGVIAADGGSPSVNAHIAVGRRDGSTAGGHLIRGVVRPQAMLTIAVLPLA
jgi:predicted DNA-binding protein with PD1-like motif